MPIIYIDGKPYETITNAASTTVGDWAYDNWDLLTEKYGVKGVWNSKFSRGDYYTITEIPGHPSLGVGTDHLGRNPHDEQVMLVERYLEKIRAENR